LRIAEGKGLNAHIDEEGGWEQEEIRALLFYAFFRFSGGIRMGIRWDEVGNSFAYRFAWLDKKHCGIRRSGKQIKMRWKAELSRNYGRKTVLRGGLRRFVPDGVGNGFENEKKAGIAAQNRTGNRRQQGMVLQETTLFC